MLNWVLLDQEEFPIQPGDIDAMGSCFITAFADRQSGEAAYWLVRMCQGREHWSSFSYEEIQMFCRDNNHDEIFWFGKLVHPEFKENISPDSRLRKGVRSDTYLVRDQDQRYHFTAEFITRCYRESPSIRLLALASV